VLPFANMSGDPEQEYFSDGITEDIITDLSKISGLFVLARNTTFAQKGQALDVQSLCHRLGVRHLVEGSVRRAGNRVRITAQLIDGKTGGHLWADRFDRELIDIFAVQDEITRSIVAALRVKLLPAEQAAISSGPTENVEAYQYYLRGRKFFYQHSRRSYEIARRLFQKACELDPLFARAYAAIADCDAFLLLHHRAEVSVDAMLAASARALELDGDLAEAHASRAFALHVQGRPDEAAREFETALRLNAELFEGWYFCARACFEQGRLHDAAHCLERAAAVSPTDFQAKGLLLMVYRSLDRPAESHAAAEEALARAERELDRDPENVRALYFAGLALTCLGQQARARELLERALAIEPDDFATLYNVACAYAQLGAVEEAIGLLERVQAPANERARRWFRAWSAHDSDLDPLRAHPRFAALMRRLADAG
jgi:adenylate cyclase